MKTYTLLSLLLFVVTSSEGQIQMNANGNVGIGVAPNATHKLRVNSMTIGTAKFTGETEMYHLATSIIFGVQGVAGVISAMYPSDNNAGSVGKSNLAFNQIYSYNYPSISDGRQKENVRSLRGTALDIVLQLEGVKYDLKREFSGLAIKNLDQTTKDYYERQRKDRIGFIAQDVFKILPEVVVHDDDSTDIYAIDYTRVVPVLVEAIKEQQQRIEDLKSKLDSLEDVQTLSAASASDRIQPQSASVSGARLDQNYPNPFTNDTEITYYCPEGVGSASLYIYNLNGNQLRSIPIRSFGNGSIRILGSELNAGIYFYSLIADGQVIATKKMVLTD